MDTLLRLNALSDQMTLEPAEEFGCSYMPQSSQPSIENQPSSKPGPGMFQAKMPGGKTISLLKTLQTSACERNCYYCPFRAGRDGEATLTECSYLYGTQSGWYCAEVFSSGTGRR
jgi:predicted DNA-binding helix-hairpin-helix protein